MEVHGSASSCAGNGIGPSAPASRSSRTMAIFNDTHDADPITFTWSLNIANKHVTGQTKDYTVSPGKRTEFDLLIPLPKVDARQEGELSLTLAVKGTEVWSDSKAVSILSQETVSKQVNAVGGRRLSCTIRLG